jgi:hypothetical protein
MLASVELALSICRSIIEARGGRLWAEANESQGAVFQFLMPRQLRNASGYLAFAFWRDPAIGEPDDQQRNLSQRERKPLPLHRFAAGMPTNIAASKILAKWFRRKMWNLVNSSTNFGWINGPVTVTYRPRRMISSQTVSETAT